MAPSLSIARVRLLSELDRAHALKGEFRGNEGQTLASVVEPLLGHLGWQAQDTKAWRFEEGALGGPIHFELRGPKPGSPPAVRVEVRRFASPIHREPLETWHGHGLATGAGLLLITNAVRWIAYRTPPETSMRPVEAFAVEAGVSDPESAAFDLAQLAKDVLWRRAEREPWLEKRGKATLAPRVDPVGLRDRITAALAKTMGEEIAPIRDRGPDETHFVGTLAAFPEGACFAIRIDPRHPVRVSARLTLRGDMASPWVRSEVRSHMLLSPHLRSRRSEMDELRFEKDERRVDEWHLLLPEVPFDNQDPVPKLVRQLAVYLAAFRESVDHL